MLLINGELRPETTRCSKCDYLLHNGSVHLDFMTDDVNEAEEMRIQTVEINIAFVLSEQTAAAKARTKLRLYHSPQSSTGVVIG